MTPAELKKLIAARQRGEEAPLLDRLAENARRPFRAPGVPDGVLWYSLIEKPEPGDVVIMRLASGEMLAGTYQEIAPHVPNYWELWPKQRRRITKQPPAPAAPPIRYELRPLDHPHRKLKYAAADVTGIFPIVDFSNITP